MQVGSVVHYNNSREAFGCLECNVECANVEMHNDNENDLYNHNSVTLSPFRGFSFRINHLLILLHPMD